MTKPFWFDVIKKWKEMGKGSYGISFPFLVGAVNHDSKNTIDEENIKKIFYEIENNPVKNYYCEVRWCASVDEPIASIKPLIDIKNVSIQATLSNSEQISFGFTTDLMSMFGLDCKTAEECREKLIKRTLDIVKNNQFSKHNGEFIPFTNSDIDFILQIKKSSNI
jgi:uncharacterized protein YlaI